MESSTPTPSESLRERFAEAGLTLTEEDLLQVAAAVPRTRLLHERLRALLSDRDEPAGAFSSLQAYPAQEE